MAVNDNYSSLSATIKTHCDTGLACYVGFRWGIQGVYRGLSGGYADGLGKFCLWTLLRQEPPCQGQTSRMNRNSGVRVDANRELAAGIKNRMDTKAGRRQPPTAGVVFWAWNSGS